MITCTVELTNFYKFLFKPTTNITFLPTNNHLSQTHNNRCEIFYQIYYVYKLSCYSSLIMIPTLFVRQNSLPLSNFFLRILLPSDLYEGQRMNDRYYDPTIQKLKFIISKKKKIEIHETMRVRYSIGLRSNQLEAHATTYPKMNSCP